MLFILCMFILIGIGCFMLIKGAHYRKDSDEEDEEQARILIENAARRAEKKGHIHA